MQILERDSYITPDGIEYSLTNPKTRVVFSWEGEGMPPIDYIAQRGPFQHGETVLNFFLRPRVLQAIVRHHHCTRAEYWTARNTLLNILRPSRQVQGFVNPGRIRKRLSNGEIRDLDVFIAEGPGFAARSITQWDELAFTEVLRFIAHNPVWYHPIQQSLDFSPDAELTFPITFPIVFGSLNTLSNLVYTGTWEEYPEIIINGPITSPTITNTTLGLSIALSATLLVGESITIDLSYGNKTVTKSDGTNLIGTVSASSDLATFKLAPAPTAPSGVNQIEVTGSGVSGDTSIEINWYRRFIGI